MQMKKLSFIIALLLSLCFQPCAAQHYAQKIEINLQVSFDDHIDIGMPYPRMPAKGSVVTISGTRMDLDEHLSPSLFVISDYDSGNVVYSQYIDAGTTSIDMPQLPSGIYTISFKKEGCCYWGYLNI